MNAVTLAILLHHYWNAEPYDLNHSAHGEKVANVNILMQISGGFLGEFKSLINNDYVPYKWRCNVCRTYAERQRVLTLHQCDLNVTKNMTGGATESKHKRTNLLMRQSR